MFNKLL